MNEPDLVSPWVPMSDPRQLKATGKAMEELGECVSAIARCQIQGVDAVEPVTLKPNKTWLTEEVADAYAMLDELVVDLDLDSSHIEHRRARKRRAQQIWKEMM